MKLLIEGLRTHWNTGHTSFHFHHHRWKADFSPELYFPARASITKQSITKILKVLQLRAASKRDEYTWQKCKNTNHKIATPLWNEKGWGHNDKNREKSSKTTNLEISLPYPSLTNAQRSLVISHLLLWETNQIIFPLDKPQETIYSDPIISFYRWGNYSQRP